MIVKLKQEYRGIAKGKEINVSEPMAKYLGSIGVIEKDIANKTEVKKKPAQSSKQKSKNQQQKDFPIQKSTAGKSKQVQIGKEIIG